ncbi:MAG: choice-of-anchor Q domain-containing protein [Cyanobacteria bacterium P01_F01_bin.53]
MKTITVTTTADKGNGSLRNAIENANNGDSIVFAKKLTGKKITLKSGQLNIVRDITIDGGNAPGIVISGNNKSRVFFLDRKKSAVLKNLTVADGYTEKQGGGIDTRHESTIVLDNVKVNNNRSAIGGGMRIGHLTKATILNSSFYGNDSTVNDNYADKSGGAIAHSEARGEIIVKNTKFVKNTGFNGGGIFSYGSVTLIVEDSVFKENKSVNRLGGGAILTDGVSSKGYDSGLKEDGKITISRSRFEGNTAEGDGGALLLWGYRDDKAILKDSVFINNKAISKGSKARGGAVYVRSELDVQNVTFANNSAHNQGGAIWSEYRLPANIVNSTFSNNSVTKDSGGALFINHRSAPVNIVNSTIAYNKAGRASGALWLARDHNVTLKNSIVAFNTAGQDRQQKQVGYQPKDGGGNLEFSTNPEASRVFKDALVADPRLNKLSLVNGDLVHTLKSGSPAINTGTRNGAPRFDQRGATRDSRVDIGAFEAGGQVVKGPQPLVQDISVDAPQFSPNKNAKATPVWERKGAVNFDGKRDIIEVASTGAIDRGTQGKKTISLSFRADKLQANGGKQVLYEEGGKWRGLNIYLEGNTLHAGGWNKPKRESGWEGTWLKKEGITAGKWYEIDVVLDGGSQVTQDAFTGYLDGKEFDSGQGSQLWSHGDGIGIGNVNNLTRFHDGLVTKGPLGFDGSIANVEVFNVAPQGNDLQAFL